LGDGPHRTSLMGDPMRPASWDHHPLYRVKYTIYSVPSEHGAPVWRSIIIFPNPAAHRPTPPPSSHGRQIYHDQHADELPASAPPSSTAPPPTTTPSISVDGEDSPQTIAIRRPCPSHRRERPANSDAPRSRPSSRTHRSPPAQSQHPSTSHLRPSAGACPKSH
ncbi:hypothetical protein ACLOJK_027564, partial [Asimina triloba]